MEVFRNRRKSGKGVQMDWIRDGGIKGGKQIRVYSFGLFLLFMIVIEGYLCRVCRREELLLGDVF